MIYTKSHNNRMPYRTIYCTKLKVMEMTILFIRVLLYLKFRKNRKNFEIFYFRLKILKRQLFTSSYYF